MAKLIDPGKARRENYGTDRLPISAAEGIAGQLQRIARILERRLEITEAIFAHQQEQQAEQEAAMAELMRAIEERGSDDLATIDFDTDMPN